MQKQFCALAAYYKDGLPAKRVAEEYGYTLSAFYTLARNFARNVKSKPETDPFFKSKSAGRKALSTDKDIRKLVISFRNRDYTNMEIVAEMKSIGHSISQAAVWRILNENGFKKLIKRNKKHAAIPK